MDIRNLKGRNLSYQPVLKYGIPRANTWEPEYQDFWKLQLKRCKEGYTPKGMRKIPGRYYFYLNFLQLRSAYGGGKYKKLEPPYYRDIDHEYFETLERAKEEGKGLIVLKARRKGQTMANIGGVCVYEMTIQSENEIGVGCFTEDQVTAFRMRFEDIYQTLPNFFKQPRIKGNEDIIKFGKKEIINDIAIETGSKNSLYFKDFYNKTGAFRGHSLSFLLFEEAGENPLLKNAYLVSEECFREGSYQFGTPIIFGTSNQINNGQKDLEEMYYEAEKYNMLTYFIPASKAYYPFIDLNTGISDEKGAVQDIEEKRTIKKSLEDKVAYYTYLQEMPLKPSDCFMLGASSIFDLGKIHEQMEYIEDNKHVKGMIQRGDLEWVKNPDGDVLREVKWVPKPKGLMKQLYPPLKENLSIDLGGVDSYTKDQSKTSDSKGAIYIYRNIANMDIPEEMPVFEYFGRPETKEDFYEICAKIAIYYDAKLLVEDTDEEFFAWFVNNGFSRYLKEAPRVYKTQWSKASNKYGYTISGANKKAHLVDCIHDYVKTNCKKIFFKDLLKEMTIFGIKNTDRVMAYGLALIHAKDVANHKMLALKKTERKPLKYPGLVSTNGIPTRII